MTAKEKPGFFERITGARVLSSDGEDAIGYEDEELTDIEIGEENKGQRAEEQYLDEAMGEQEAEQEEDYSDEASGEPGYDEQEGQLTVDVFQDDTNIVIQSTIAGVAPEDLDVSITNDMVTIRGERRRMYDVDPEDFFYQECYWGTFSRSIILPVEIDSDRAEAKIKNGILTIRIPKANTAMTRKLKVKASWRTWTTIRNGMILALNYSRREL